MHDGIVAAVRGELLLVLFTAFAEGTLLDAEGCYSALHAPEGKVTVTFDAHLSFLVFPLDGNGMVHSGGVPLEADHERARLLASFRQADVGGNVGVGFASENDLFNCSKGMLSLPDGCDIEVYVGVGR